MELDLKPLKLLGNLNAQELWPTCSVVVLGWGLLVFAPRWKYTKSITLLPPLFHSLLYTLTLISGMMAEPDASVDFNSLEGIVTLFKDPTTVFAGWLHYVAFDLLIGRSIVFDSVARDIGLIGHCLFIIPCLLFTFMVGPFGWLLYTVISHTLLPKKNMKEKTV